MFIIFSYRLRIEGLLVKEEFNTNLEYIRPSIDSVIEAAKGRFKPFLSRRVQTLLNSRSLVIADGGTELVSQ